jgi:hypothetical protein
VLGGSGDEVPRGFGVYLESVYHPSGDVNERAGGCPYGLIVTKVERKLSLEDVERLVVLPMDVKRRPFPSGSSLLDDREPTTGLFCGGFLGSKGPESPERRPFLGS